MGKFPFCINSIVYNQMLCIQIDKNKYVTFLKLNTKKFWDICGKKNQRNSTLLFIVKL